MKPVPAAAPVEDLDNNCFDPKAFGQMERMLRDLRRLYQERNEALQEVSRAHHEALFRLALAAETRDDETGVHIVRMGFLAEALAREVGLSVDEAEAALGLLREQRGRAFDPGLVDVFLGATRRFIELRDRINQLQPRFTALQEGLPA